MAVFSDFILQSLILFRIARILKKNDESKPLFQFLWVNVQIESYLALSAPENKRIESCLVPRTTECSPGFGLKVVSLLGPTNEMQFIALVDPLPHCRHHFGIFILLVTRPIFLLNGLQILWNKKYQLCRKQCEIQ